MVVVLMGVCGCGKTAVGERLAAVLGAPFYDADGFHPPENVEKMRSGTPLTDADRRPWLERLNASMRKWNRGRESGFGAVLACSALRKSYRDRLREGLDGQVRLVHLHGSRELLEARLAARKGHYMPAGLLDSQLEILEWPAPDEGALPVDVSAAPEELARRIERMLRA